MFELLGFDKGHDTWPKRGLNFPLLVLMSGKALAQHSFNIMIILLLLILLWLLLLLMVLLLLLYTIIITIMEIVYAHISHEVSGFQLQLFHLFWVVKILPEVRTAGLPFALAIYRVPAYITFLARANSSGTALQWQTQLIKLGERMGVYGILGCCS